MTVDRSKLQFYNVDPIDKVVLTNTAVHSNTANSYSSSSSAEEPVIDNVTIPNPYGKKCFVRYKWSVDGTNFNSQRTNLLYPFTVAVSGAFGNSTGYRVGCKAAVAMWVSDSEIGFQYYNDYHSNQTEVVASDFTSKLTQTGFSLNFTVEYALFEIV